MPDVGRSEGKWNIPTRDEIGQEKQRVAERLARLDTERARLADQLGELEIAERVLTRFGRAARTGRRRRGGLATTAPAGGGERSARGTRRTYRDKQVFCLILLIRSISEIKGNGFSSPR